MSFFECLTSHIDSTEIFPPFSNLEFARILDNSIFVLWEKFGRKFFVLSSLRKQIQLTRKCFFWKCFYGNHFSLSESFLQNRFKYFFSSFLVWNLFEKLINTKSTHSFEIILKLKNGIFRKKKCFSLKRERKREV